jgi:hypothetical protein
MGQYHGGRKGPCWLNKGKIIPVGLNNLGISKPGRGNTVVVNMV